VDGSNALHRLSTKGEEETVHGHFFCQSSFAIDSIALESNVVKVPEDTPLELLGRWVVDLRLARARHSTRCVSK
jgi:aryl-alcohol dehydrogenase